MFWAKHFHLIWLCEPALYFKAQGFISLRDHSGLKKKISFQVVYAWGALDPLIFLRIYTKIDESQKISSFQSLSHVQCFAIAWTTAHQASLSITNSRSSLRLTSIESVMPSSHLILCRPLLLLSAIPRSIRVFSNESTLRMRWPKYWSFSFSISPSNEHPGLVSFKMDWLDLLAVQGTLKSLLQHHSSEASILRCSAFFIVPTLTSIHDYWKNHSFD